VKGKLLLIGVGVGIGYILGAKAGRERYDQIVAAFGKVRHNPMVEKSLDTATDFVSDRLDDLAVVVNAGAKKIVDRVTTGKRSARPRPSSKAPVGRNTVADASKVEPDGSSAVE